jgi:DnaJ family protein B protein 12
MEVNKEEALRCLSIAQKHRNAANLPSALKFARKSVSLFTTPEGEKMVQIIETEISVSSSGSGGGSSTSTANGSGSSTPNGNAEAGPSSAGTAGGGKAKASGVEEHISGSARHRPGHSATAAAGSGGGAAGGSAKAEGKKREYTVKQMEVVKRIKSCQGHQYYEILSGTSRLSYTGNVGVMVKG